MMLIAAAYKNQHSPELAITILNFTTIFDKANNKDENSHI